MTKALAAYLFTKDSKLQEQYEAAISAGGMLVNDTAVHVIISINLASNFASKLFIYSQNPY
jgi:acyl-CoA reductase-like NAD-dependent aldehyde dehydrogenase